jgi:hypothetical protein
LDSVNGTEVGSRSLGEIRSRIAAGLVGRERELDLLLEAAARGRDLALEGRREPRNPRCCGRSPPGGYPTDIRGVNADLDAKQACRTSQPGEVIAAIVLLDV